MMKTYRKKSPTYKVVYIKGVKTKSGYKLLSEKDIDEFAKYIQFSWFWDAKQGEVKFDILWSKGLGVPIYSVKIGYYIVSDGTPKMLTIYDEVEFERTFEKVSNK